MIDITSTRQNAFNMHPPAVVYWLLFVFSGGSALMAGYSMKRGPHDWLYSIALARGGDADGVYDSGRGVSAAGIDPSTSDRDRTLLSLRDSMK